MQAHKDWTTNGPQILRLADKEGWTIAHEQASQGWVTDNLEILKLRDSKGVHIYEFTVEYSTKKPDQADWGKLQTALQLYSITLKS